MEVWPEHWGMRMHQIRELLNSCKAGTTGRQCEGILLVPGFPTQYFTMQSGLLTYAVSQLSTTSKPGCKSRGCFNSVGAALPEAVCGQEDVHWHQSHSVRDMVNQHLLPRTAGEGVGRLAEDPLAGRAMFEVVCRSLRCPTKVML